MEAVQEEKVEHIRKAKRASVFAAQEWANELQKSKGREREDNTETAKAEDNMDERSYSFNESQNSRASLNFSQQLKNSKEGQPVEARTPEGYATVAQLVEETIRQDAQEWPLRKSGEIQVRVGRVGLSSQTSLVRTKTHVMRVGNGQLSFLKKGDGATPIALNIISIKGISYSKMSSRSFTVRTEDGMAFWMRAKHSDEAHLWVKSILEELRIYAFMLSACAKRLMENSSKNEHSIDSLLRVAVDLYAIAKGHSHPDSTAAKDALARWCEEQGNKDQAAYWYDWAGKGRINYNNESRQEDTAINLNIVGGRGGFTALHTIQRRRAETRGANRELLERRMDYLYKIITEVSQSKGETKEAAVESML